ncbi:F-box protein [Phanerochaete sordida]|uniref:F-box protein n=1 Tax=Phanerochaete sordida TaxID=48140 RepID=A0A9P3GH59_9APHY|nr:F-box protein [Phanerochaete sordida]
MAQQAIPDAARLPSFHPEISRASRIFKEKKQKQTKPRAPAKRPGKLGIFLDLPEEVFLQVACHLGSKDLLNLVDVCQRFRDVLLRPGHRYAWVSARQNMPDGLPGPHPWMSEPEYAQALFRRVCTACTVGFSDELDYASMDRFCLACRKANYARGSTLLRRKIYAGVREDASFKTLVMPFYPTEKLLQTSDGQNVDAMEFHYYKPEFDAVHAQYETARSQGPQALQDFIAARRGVVTTKLQHAAATHGWSVRHRERREDTAEALKEKFEACVIERLEAEGYRVADFPPADKTEWRNLISQRKTMSERIWGNLLPQLKEAIEIERTARQRAERENELRTIYQAFLTRLTPHMLMYFPTPQRIPKYEPLQLHLGGPNIDIPVTEARFVETMLPILNSETRGSFACTILWYAQGLGVDTSTLAAKVAFIRQWRGLSYAARCMLRTPSLSLTPARMLHYHECLSEPGSLAPDVASYYKLVPDPTCALQVLGAIGLPSNIRYDAISHRLICTCGDPTFLQPAPFSDLVTHIWRENSWYQAFVKHSQNDPELLHQAVNIHSLMPYRGFLVQCPPHLHTPVAAGVPAPSDGQLLELLDDKVKCEICDRVAQPIWDLTDRRTVCQEMTGRVFLHHFRTKHGREPRWEDAVVKM